MWLSLGGFLYLRLCIEVWRFPQRLPLLPIVAKNDERYLLSLDEIEEFAGACPQLFLIVIQRPCPAIWGK